MKVVKTLIKGAAERVRGSEKHGGGKEVEGCHSPPTKSMNYLYSPGPQVARCYLGLRKPVQAAALFNVVDGHVFLHLLGG